MIVAMLMPWIQLQQHLKMNIEDVYKIPNPLPFWKQYQQKFPCLSLIARRLFSIPVTSAAVERSFSAAGLAVTERRSSLNPQTLNDILFVRSIQNILEKKARFVSLTFTVSFALFLCEALLNKLLM